MIVWDEDDPANRQAARAWLAAELSLDDAALTELVGGGWFSSDLHLYDEATDEPLSPSAPSRWYFAGDVGRVGLSIAADEIRVVRGVNWGYGQLPGIAITPVAEIRRTSRTWKGQLAAAVVEASKQVRARYAMCWHCHQMRYSGKTRRPTDFRCDWCWIEASGILF